MLLIKVFSDFDTSKNCKERIEKISFLHKIDYYGKDKKIYITDEDNYTHAIILNTIMPKLTIPKENVIGLACEPIPFLHLTKDFVDYAKIHIGKYFIGDKMNLPDPFIEGNAYMWYSLPSVIIKDKTKLMSIVLSQKRFAPGHNYRHLLVEKIIQNNLPIDIYGRGSSSYNYPTVKGIFNELEPYTDYYYSICIENYQSRHYFSEKIITPLLCNCSPIYLGCHNIDQYFDNIIKLTGKLEDDILILINILKNPAAYYNLGYNEKNIKTVNLIENIENLYL